MDQASLQKSLLSLPIAELRYFESIGSTNDEALNWAVEGAMDFSLVVADEQTAGRGRADRKWVTPKGAALAFSLILRPSSTESKFPSLLTGLGAVALVDALRTVGLAAQIKWPNDVLVGGNKIAGILVETSWVGDKPDAIILGIGLNVSFASTPLPEELSFPGTSMEAETATHVDRVDILRRTLKAIFKWRGQLATGELLKTWDQSLAYKGQLVQTWAGADSPAQGILDGLEADGSLRLVQRDKTVTVHFGEIHLRPA